MAINYPKPKEGETLFEEAGNLSGSIVLEEIFFGKYYGQRYDKQEPQEWWMDHHGLNVLGKLKIRVVKEPVLNVNIERINPTAWMRSLLMKDEVGNSIKFWCGFQGINPFQTSSNQIGLPNYYYRKFDPEGNVLSEQKVAFRTIGNWDFLAWESQNSPFYVLYHTVGDFYPHPEQQHYFTRCYRNALQYYGQSGFGRVMKILRGQLMIDFPEVTVNTEEGRLTSVHIGNFHDDQTNPIYTYEHPRS